MWNKYLHFALPLFKDWKLDHLTFLKLFAIKVSGLILLSIHQWRFTGAGLQVYLILHIGTQQNFGGKDGLKHGQAFHYFHLTELLISDKIFRINLETAIGLLKWLRAQSFHHWLRMHYLHKLKIMLQFMLWISI